ncbi:hypothetical protein GCM10010321_48820 [Streptomyces chartreusis]|nr:hypothetical protein GCM10010321_48820 [Streptomyces chartreusis]
MKGGERVAARGGRMREVTERDHGRYAGRRRARGRDRPRPAPFDWSALSVAAVTLAAWL